MTNLAFTALIKSKGYNQKSLAEETGIPPGVLSPRINSRDIWTWPEVSAVCAALGITYDEFATYYPVANVRKSEHLTRKIHRWDALLVDDRKQLAHIRKMGTGKSQKGY